MNQFHQRRRAILAFAASALAPFASLAQQPSSKIFRIGFMGAGSAAQMTSRVEALRRGLFDISQVGEAAAQRFHPARHLRRGAGAHEADAQDFR